MTQPDSVAAASIRPTISNIFLDIDMLLSAERNAFDAAEVCWQAWHNRGEPWASPWRVVTEMFGIDANAQRTRFGDWPFTPTARTIHGILCIRKTLRPSGADHHNVDGRTSVPHRLAGGRLALVRIGRDLVVAGNSLISLTFALMPFVAELFIQACWLAHRASSNPAAIFE